MKTNEQAARDLVYQALDEAEVRSPLKLTNRIIDTLAEVELIASEEDAPETPVKPEPPLKTQHCGGRYWHDPHPFNFKTANGKAARAHCDGWS